jgi:UDP-arabinose 4-epimerase
MSIPLKALHPQNRILVIGGAGYIGSHVCKALLQNNFHPVIYDNLSTGHSWALQLGSFYQGDLENETLLLKTIEEVKPKAIIHLASLINVRDSIANPTLYYEKNLIGSLCLLKAMVKTGVTNLIFSSTAAVYGAPQSLPIDETHPKAPLNAYGKTKWAIEGMIEDFAHAHHLRFVTLRYFNACGAHLDGDIGEAHQPETHLIPLAIQTALGKRSPLQIYGNNYPTPDGTAIRDYVHVSDLASAHVKALCHLLTKKNSLTVNLGTGQGHSVKQVLKAIETFSNKIIPTQIFPRLPHDSPELVANPSLANKILNWFPENSNLTTIIASAWRWELINSDRFVIN